MYINDLIKDEGDQRVRLIGQERDGAVIFCWDAVIPEQQVSLPDCQPHLHVDCELTRNSYL